jgi:hypothetical protein
LAESWLMSLGFAKHGFRQQAGLLSRKRAGPVVDDVAR